ncbi:MAG: glycoside hydrolase family 3 protein [Treponema sp.]|jgi:beta-N-acetylhexosaminidase|nr:glycoside hydrolase family 3 protein [Treponema sp.]
MKLPVLWLFVLCVLSCGGKPEPGAPSVAPDLPGAEFPAEGREAAASLPAASLLASSMTMTAVQDQAARIAASLDDRLLAAQVIMTGIEGKGALSGAMRELLARIPAGSVMLFSYNLDTAAGIRSLLEETSSLVAASSGNAAGGPGGIAPFIAVDHEGGPVNRFGAAMEGAAMEGAVSLPPAASFWVMAQREGRAAALEAVGAAARRSGRELRKLGITMNLAPVAEVLSEENRRFLADRSYGPDPGFVEQAAAAFIGGMEAEGICCTLKHFPGNSGADPHLGAVLLTGDRDALRSGVRPFAALIRRPAPPAMMVSHAVVPAWDGERNASLSPAVIQDWIRGELGFQGILAADDFSMASAAGMDPREAAVEALRAGIDMVMTWPPELSHTHGAILSALEEGRLSRERVREAAARILAEKIRYGIYAPDWDRD